MFRADAETGDLFDALHGRLSRVLGAEFAENALRIDATREGLHLTGYAALPTYSRGAAVAQYLFVNGRPVRDKMLYGALRAAYSDFLSRDRHPAAALFIDCDPTRVDVNVHPAKAEVRFREPGLARGLIVSGLRHALAEAGHRASTTVAGATLGAMRPEPVGAPRIYQMDRPVAGCPARRLSGAGPGVCRNRGRCSRGSKMAGPRPMRRIAAGRRPRAAARELHHRPDRRWHGHRRSHAAHERLVYEKLKRQMADNGVAAQALLIPEIVEMSDADAARLLDIAGDLTRLGLSIEPFGGGAIAVRETPAILGQVDAKAMLSDILDELDDLGDSQSVQARIEAVLCRVACHGSVRSGSPDAGRRDERPAARDGGDAAFGPVQPWATHLCGTEAV